MGFGSLDRVEHRPGGNELIWDAHRLKCHGKESIHFITVPTSPFVENLSDDLLRNQRDDFFRLHVEIFERHSEVG